MNHPRQPALPSNPLCTVSLWLCACIGVGAHAQSTPAAPPSATTPSAITSSANTSSANTVTAIAALPSLNVPAYMGAWYQVAWFPNRFQKQCVSDTTATYRLLPDGQVQVTNRCRVEGGSFDSVVGIARPANAVLRGSQLEPAQLEVSFLPTWLRWLPIWGSYWVLNLAPDGRYVVVGEPKREYLWVLARAPMLSAADETAIRSWLLQKGYDLSRWQNHPHASSAQPPQPVTSGALPPSAPWPAPIQPSRPLGSVAPAPST